MRAQLMVILLLSLIFSSNAYGTITNYINKAQWRSAVGLNHHTINFQEVPLNTFVTTQYQDLGITFTDGNDLARTGNHFLNDGVGLDGNGDIALSFSTPQYWIAGEFTSFMQFRLLYQGSLIGDSSLFDVVVSRFGGVISTQPFDQVLIGGIGQVFLDDIYFGPTIPAPSSVAMILAAVMAWTRRRRS